jgi:hypothetical protein
MKSFFEEARGAVDQVITNVDQLRFAFTATETTSPLVKGDSF